MTRSELFHPQNFAGMEAHLEKMALQGKFLETIKRSKWRYRKGEPKPLKYAVTFFKDGSIYNSVTPQSLQDYYDYCAQDGWNLVAESGAMQVFANENVNATPIDTDPAEKLENIHKICKKTVIYPGITMIFLYVFLSYIQYDIYQMNRTEWLSSLHNFYIFGVMAIAALYMAGSLIAYCSWYRRSKKSVETGGDLIPSYGTAHRIMGWVYMVILVVLMFCYVLASDLPSAGIYLASIGLVFVFCILFSRIITWIKLLRKSKTFNFIATISIYAIAAMTITASLTYVMIRYDFFFDKREPVKEIIWYDMTVPIYQDEIPLTVEDLYGIHLQDSETRESDISKSFLLEKSEYIDNIYLNPDNLPELSYTVYSTEYSWVYDICRDDLLTDEEWEDDKFAPIDPSPWSANQVYIKRNNYVIFYDGILLELHLTQPPTDQEIQKIVQVLAQ